MQITIVKSAITLKTDLTIIEMVAMINDLSVEEVEKVRQILKSWIDR